MAVHPIPKGLKFFSEKQRISPQFHFPEDVFDPRLDVGLAVFEPADPDGDEEIHG